MLVVKVKLVIDDILLELMYWIKLICDQKFCGELPEMFKKSFDNGNDGNLLLGTLHQISGKICEHYY